MQNPKVSLAILQGHSWQRIYKYILIFFQTAKKLFGIRYLPHLLTSQASQRQVSTQSMLIHSKLIETSRRITFVNRPFHTTHTRADSFIRPRNKIQRVHETSLGRSSLIYSLMFQCACKFSCLHSFTWLFFSSFLFIHVSLLLSAFSIKTPLKKYQDNLQTQIKENRKEYVNTDSSRASIKQN